MRPRERGSVCSARLGGETYPIGHVNPSLVEYQKGKKRKLKTRKTRAQTGHTSSWAVNLRRLTSSINIMISHEVAYPMEEIDSQGGDEMRAYL